mgnify:FL=1
MGREQRSGLYDMPQEPELEDLFRVFERGVQLGMRVALPARVVATVAQPQGFDPATRKVSVEVGFRQVAVNLSQDASDGVTVQPAITLQNIPVSFPCSTQGGIFFQITQNDTGLLIVADRSMTRWLAGDGRAADPVNMWTHNLQDSVFIPGLTPDSKVPVLPPSNTATTLTAQNEILLGQNATLKLINEQLLVCLDAFANAVPVPNDGGAAIQTSFKTAYLLVKDLMTTTKVKAE